MDDFQSLLAGLSKAESLLICAHVSPDADAVGSSVGLARIMNSLGKKASVYLQDPVPEKLTGLVTQVDVFHEVPKEKYSAVVVLDTASQSRLGRDSAQVLALGESTFNVDHHVSNDRWCEVNFIDPVASSTSEIVLRIARELGAEVDSDTANLLYAGVADDTGLFRFSNTNVSSFDAASFLVASGASPDAVSNALYFSLPLRVLKLRAKAIDSLRLHLDGKIAMVAISLKDLEELGATPEDTDHVVEIARSVEGTIGAIFMRELEESAWKMSLRSKGDEFDCNLVASKFGGGGHRAAAGCRIDAPQQEAEEQILAEVSRLL